MKKTLLYLAAALACSTGFTSCDDDFESPKMIVPTATIEANTTIAELKAAFASTSESNYANVVGNKDSDGTHYIIAGRVTSSDQAGNYFKQIVIADETSAIQLDVDAYDLYESYQLGQEVVLDVTGLYCGAYGKLVQIGAAPSSGYPSRIASATFSEHAQVNGLSKPDAIQATEVTISELNTIKNVTEDWLNWQCRLVTIKGVTFDDAGKETLSTSGSNGVSRTIKDADGNSIIVYTSGYSDFYDYYCPTGSGDITAILSCYNANWQLRLVSIDGLQNFETLSQQPSETPGGNGNETGGAGTEENPYTVADVNAGASSTSAWVKGYIVGWIEGQVLSSGAHFDAAATVQTNVLLADSKDCTDVSLCIPVQLPSGEIRNAVNLQNNPGNLGKELMIQGSLEKYFGTAGVKSATAYKLEGADNETPTTPTDPVSSLDENFDASTSLPTGWTQVQIAGTKTWYVTAYNGNNYAAMTGYKGTAPFDSWLVSPAIDMSKVTNKTLTFDTQVNGYSSKTSVFEAYVLTSADVANATKTKLNATMATAPASGYSDWASSGSIDLSSYSGTIYIAFRYYATTDDNYATWCLDNVKLNAAASTSAKRRK